MPKKDAYKRKRLMNIAIIDERNDGGACSYDFLLCRKYRLRCFRNIDKSTLRSACHRWQACVQRNRRFRFAHFCPFSATGNCKYTAQRIAAATGEKIISITECVKQQQYRFSSDNETVGIITPTYAWGLPSIVRDFCMRLCWRIPRPICGFSPHTEQARDKLDVLPTKSCSAKGFLSQPILV